MSVTGRGGDRRRRRRGRQYSESEPYVLILARGGERRWVRRRPVGVGRTGTPPGRRGASCRSSGVARFAARTPPSCTGSSGQWAMPALPRPPGWRRAPGSETAAAGSWRPFGRRWAGGERREEAQAKEKAMMMQQATAVPSHVDLDMSKVMLAVRRPDYKRVLAQCIYTDGARFRELPQRVLWRGSQTKT